MKQFSLLKHTANLFCAGPGIRMAAVILLVLITRFETYAQCSVNPVSNQTFCHLSSTSAINFTGTATTFNWVNNTPSIGLAASGSGNINPFTAVNFGAAAVTATITVTPSNGACIGTPVSFTITVNPLPPVYIMPNASCGSCGSLTGAGASNYTWSPITGLFTDCQLTQAYTGGLTNTVYTSPTNNNYYQVTGVNAVTGCLKSASGAINIAPAAPVIVPSAVNMCLGDAPVKIKVAASITRQFCSGPVNIAVPDNNVNGDTSKITVSGIPAAGLLFGVWVTINMTHTRMGNMVFVLQAPNGQVLNLDYYLGATGGTGSTTGFSNTIISSQGGMPFVAGTSPFSTTFAAQAQPSPAGGFGPHGPTGRIQTVNNWTGLTPTTASANGTWTLAFYDGVTGDVGTLNDWCISFAYGQFGQNITQQAVWTPAVGLFLDPAATIPYNAGTRTDSVYTRPTPAGTYTYQVTTAAIPPGTCVSPPTSVVVNVGTPAIITSHPANQTLCSAGGSASFSVGVSGGSGYQWQVSINGGATWNNIVNAAPYSGVNTATLTINPVSIGMNGYLYRLSIGSCSGNILSNAALLSINPIPSVTITANPVVIGPTQSTTIFSTVTPNPATSYAWYYNTALLTGQTSPSLVVNYGSPGDYQLKVTDANNCGVGVSNIITIANSFAGFQYVYPNPSGGIIQVRHPLEPNTPAQRTLNVFNNQGNLLLSKTVTQTIPYQAFDVDLRAYGPGIYWVEWRVANGGRLAMGKVVVN